MVLCDNAFCSHEIIELEYVARAGRKFCCVACADAWQHQNEAFADAATPLRDRSGSRKEHDMKKQAAERRETVSV